MGHWSVACNISGLTIGAGEPLVILPIKKAKYQQEFGYLPYLPFTLPIFGEYNDYGGIENIQENDNTKAIEEYFDCTIQEFCDYFTEYVTYDRSEYKEIGEKLEGKLVGVDFCFIHGKVYESLSSGGGDGSLDFGRKELLEDLGFEYQGERADAKRYKYIWTKEGKTFWSDGKSLVTPTENGKYQYVFYYGGDHTGSYCLTNYVSIPENMQYLENASQVDLWRYMDRRDIGLYLGSAFGKRHLVQDDNIHSMIEFLEERGDNSELLERYKKMLKKQADTPAKNIRGYYLKNLDTFGDDIAKLCNVRGNMYPMSQYFKPNVKYMTPQDGERETHIKLLKKFIEILEERIQDW